MQLFEKDPEEMTLEEARAAFDHAIRNLSFRDVCTIEDYPQACEPDEPHRALCKRLARRIRELE